MTSIVRPALVQTANRVPPKSLVRDMAFAEQQAIMLSAGEPGTGTCWTAMHKSLTELAQNAQWRMVLGATPDAGPRSTCALQEGNDGDMCEQSLATHPFRPFCCKYGGARARSHRAVQHTLRRLIEQAGGSRTWSAMSLSSTTGRKTTTKLHP